MMLNSHRAKAVLVASCGLLVCSACTKKSEGDSADATVTPVVSVETASVLKATFTPSVRATGTVVASPKGYAELSAPAPSRVSRVLVTAGQAVHAGDILVQLDAAALQAASSSANAARDAAQKAYERASRLAQEGILPRKAVDQASADLAQANATDVGARRTFALSTLRAPISGVVTKVNAVTGASADPSQVLVAVADPSALQILLQLSPSDAAMVRNGAVVTLFDSDAPSAQAIGRGVVATVGAAVDSVTRAVPIHVRLVSSTRPLRLGETVSGRIASSSSMSAVSVPSAAVVPDSSGFKVYVVKGGVAYSTPVEVGARGDSVVQITKGLTAGQTVVTLGAYGLEDSSKVTVPKR